MSVTSHVRPESEVNTMTDGSSPVLSVRDLALDFATDDGGYLRVLDGVSFEIKRGEVFGLVGESGSGKSVTMLAVLGLLPEGKTRIVSGEILLNGRNLLTATDKELRSIRGSHLAMIFQDPMTSLNPVMRIGTQIGEAVRLHRPGLSQREVRDRVVELLEMVGMPNPDRRHRQYPHEFSGGMRQRAMIAMAVANEPTVLLADEPTTALDVTIQAQVMEVLADVRKRTGASMILVTHDLGLVAERADRVAVMYSGRIVELGDVEEIFQTPSHPYTAGLISSLPRLEAPLGRLYSIPGQPPALSERPGGCAFHPRCDLFNLRAACAGAAPELTRVASGQLSACHFVDEIPKWRRQVRSGGLGSDSLPDASGSRTQQENDTPVLRLTNLTRQFRVQRSSGWGFDLLNAVDDVSLTLPRGETLGLVGESGCGKSTLGRTILRLLEPTAGAVYLDGRDLSAMGRSELRRHRPRMQVVFQDPYSSLDPRMSVHDIVAEPLRINGIYDPDRITELLSYFGLGKSAEPLKPTQFSGGQRQRIAIARALALGPALLILDEAVSALDVSIQAQVINLLKRLQEQLNLTYLFISHDLSVVRNICDKVAVMYLGKIVEIGTREQVFGAPLHPYTQSLLSAVPIPDPVGRSKRKRIVLEGDLPNPLALPSGCSFRTRCFKVEPRCAEQSPDLLEVGSNGQLAACYYPGAPLEV